MKLLRELQITYRPLVGSAPGQRQPLTTASAAAALVRPMLEHESVEVLGILLLNTRHEPLAWHVLSRGTLDATLVHPREVVKAACLGNAAAIILAHNHPSGDPNESPEDLAVAERLRKVLELVGITLLDSLIVGDCGRWSSLRERGDL